MALRVLSIDGGGMRGIYAAAYLDALESAFIAKRGCIQGLDIGKVFQLVVGTSTGAIIGCGIAKGVAPSEIVQLYKHHGTEVFPKKLPDSLNWHLLIQLLKRSKYNEIGDSALRSALVELLGHTTIGQVWEQRGIALAVTAVNMSTYRPWVFKTPHDPKSNHRDDKYTLAEVCVASSSAPLFRSLAAIDHPTGLGYDVFTDGGLWANNPVLIAIVEALRMSKDLNEEIEIFSLGSCSKPEGELIQKDQVHRGIIDWKFGGEAAKVAVTSQIYAFDMMAEFITPHLNNKVSLIRFPSDKIPYSMHKYLDLDETRPDGLEALIKQARYDASLTNSAIQKGSSEGLKIESLFNEMPQREV